MTHRAAFYRTTAARAYWMRGELREARQLMREAIDTTKRLIAAGRTELARGVAHDLDNLAEIERAADDFAAARDAAAEAVSILDTLPDSSSGVLRQRYKALMDVGTFAFRLAEYAQARTAFDRAAEDARALLAIVRHPILERQLVEALSDGAAARFEFSDFHGGRERLREGAALAAGWDENDEELMTTAGKVLNSLAYAEQRLGGLQAAKDAAGRALAVRRRLFEQDPRKHRANLKMTLGLLGNVERAIDSSATSRYAEGWSVGGAPPTRRAPSAALPPWTEHARRFFALRQWDDLGRAIEACDEERVGAFLRAIRPLRSPNYPTEPLVRALAIEGRRTEAALVNALFHVSNMELMSLREFQMMWAVQGFDPQSFLALVELCEVYDLHDCAAAILFVVGKLLCELFDHSHGLELLLRARADLEASGRQASLMTLHASLLNSIGAARTTLRDHAGAAAVLIEAVELRRKLAADGDSVETMFLANALYNLGHARFHAGESGSAAYFEEALAAYRRVDDETLAQQAKCLSALGTTAARRRDFAAFEYFAEALECARAVHRRQAELVTGVNADAGAGALAAYDPILVSTLLDAAQMLLSTLQWRSAQVLVDEVFALLDELPPQARRHLAQFHAAANDLRVKLLQRMQRDADAAVAAHEAIALAEETEVAPGDRHHLKGHVREAYRVRLREIVAAGDAAGVYATLCALRSGDFLARAAQPAATLAAGRDAIAAVERAAGKRVAMLIAETVGDDVLLAVLTSGGLAPLLIERDFIRASSHLWRRLDQILGGAEAEDPMRELADLGAAAWRALPEAVRTALAFGDHADILVSADDYWSAFPWEALFPGSWLSLTHALARWSDLSPSGLAALRPGRFGKGVPVAAVISPWDAIAAQPLAGAQVEAVVVAMALARKGYLLIDDGVCEGARATSAALLDAIAQEPAVLHFSGHGAIARGEEVLVMAGPALFGSAELREYCRQYGAPRAFRGQPLVVLNCCETGRTRSFGGEREDLVGLLLAQGCAGVIAWPVEVLDEIGACVGNLLYATEAAGGMGAQLARLRQAVAGEFPQQPLWLMLQYHGNPYMTLPLTDVTPASPSS